MQKMFQIEGKTNRQKQKPSPVRASRKARECGSSSFSEVVTAIAAAAAAVLEFNSLLSSIIAAIPRTFKEAQQTVHCNFRFPTVVDFTPKHEIGNSLEVVAAEAAKVENVVAFLFCISFSSHLFHWLLGGFVEQGLYLSGHV
ncbi:hypothetical protein FXO38_01974 [Capsicum annuum]|nr:hypothetical protein FXO38_01974 [Capsicum annuum]KAF3683080.1 hypothetical protein FXO37_02026 [Capsicum annuum]